MLHTKFNILPTTKGMGCLQLMKQINKIILIILLISGRMVLLKVKKNASSIVHIVISLMSQKQGRNHQVVFVIWIFWVNLLFWGNIKHYSSFFTYSISYKYKTTLIWCIYTLLNIFMYLCFRMFFCSNISTLLSVILNNCKRVITCIMKRSQTTIPFYIWINFFLNEIPDRKNFESLLADKAEN